MSTWLRKHDVTARQLHDLVFLMICVGSGISFVLPEVIRMPEYFLVVKFIGVLPLSPLTHITMAAEYFSKVCSTYRIVCPSLLLTYRMTLSENSCTAFTTAPQGLNNAYRKGKSWCSFQQFKEAPRSFDGRMTTEPAFEINILLTLFSYFCVF